MGIEAHRAGRGLSLVGSLVALLMCLVAPGVLGASASAAEASEAAEAVLLDGMNGARAAENLPPLVGDGDLAALARAWSTRMRDDYEATGDATDALRHNPAVFDEIPHRYHRAAENVGYVSGDGSAGALADRLLERFLSSPGHRGNILGDFTRAGVGLARAADGTLFGTVVFTDGAVSEPEQDDGDPEPSSRPEGSPSSRDERDDADQARAPDSEGEAQAEPQPQPEPEAPAVPTVEELFGVGWPDGYLVAGGKPTWPDWLLSVPGSAYRLVLGLGNGFTPVHAGD